MRVIEEVNEKRFVPVNLKMETLQDLVRVKNALLQYTERNDVPVQDQLYKAYESLLYIRLKYGTDISGDVT